MTATNFRFRQMPVDVHAMQWIDPEQAHVLVDWADGVVHYDPRCSGPADPQTGEDWGRLEVDSTRGTHVATPGDWLVKGAGGEFHLCKPAAFATSYEPAGETA